MRPSHRIESKHAILRPALATRAVFPGRAILPRIPFDKLLGNTGIAGGRYEQMQEFDRIRADIMRQSNGKGLSAELIADLEARYKRLSGPEAYGRAGHTEATDSLIGRKGNYNQLGESLQKLKAYYEQLEKLRKNEAATINGQDELESLRRAGRLRRQESKAAADVSANVKDALGPAAKIAQYAEWTASSYERSAAALGRLRGPRVSNDPYSNFAAHGGAIRRFSSGGGVGTDIVPAMLSPGEFVVSAAAARAFYPQLTAINAGSRPPSVPGSSVTNHNTTIGDVNVSVPYGSAPQMVRQIASLLDREMRRRK